MRDPVDRIWSQIRMMKAGWSQNLLSSEMNLYSLVSLFDSPSVELRSDYLRTFMLWRKAYGEHSFLILSFNELLSQVGLVRLFKFLGISESWMPSNELTKKVLASPSLKLPDELRWLYANRWSTMLKSFSTYYPDALIWLNQLLIDEKNMPPYFLDKVREIREIQVKSTLMKWHESNQYYHSLSMALASRLDQVKA